MQSTKQRIKGRGKWCETSRYFDISISPVLLFSGVSNDGNILSHSDHFTTFHNTSRQTDYFEKTSVSLSHRQARRQCYCSVRKLKMINRLDYFTTTINYTCSPVCLRFSINKVIIGRRAGQYYPGHISRYLLSEIQFEEW